jgi:hypothetical protein
MPGRLTRASCGSHAPFVSVRYARLRSARPSAPDSESGGHSRWRTHLAVTDCGVDEHWRRPACEVRALAITWGVAQSGRKSQPPSRQGSAPAGVVRLCRRDEEWKRSFWTPSSGALYRGPAQEFLLCCRSEKAAPDHLRWRASASGRQHLEIRIRSDVDLAAMLP